MEKTIFELDLFETIVVPPNNTGNTEYVRRVPGGWLHIVENQSTFIPFNEEFKNKEIKFKIPKK